MGTAPSSRNDQMKTGGVVALTLFSFERSSINSDEGFSPKRLRRDPAWLKGPIEMTA